MLLAVDIGNSHVKFGVYDGEHLLAKFSIPTNREASPADFRLLTRGKLDLPISDAIICSVVPEVNDSTREYLLQDLGVTPIFVANDMDFGLTINYEPLAAIGTDRLVNAFTAVEKYSAPCIVCSFGTALTIDAVDEQRALLGGVIAPGMNTLTTALKLATSQLPEVPIEKPDMVIQNTTAGSIKSGVVYGYFGLVEGLLSRVIEEIDDLPQIIATGGSARFVAENTTRIDMVDENLTLDGLQLLYGRLNLRV